MFHHLLVHARALICCSVSDLCQIKRKSSQNYCLEETRSKVSAMCTLSPRKMSHFAPFFDIVVTVRLEFNLKISQRKLRGQLDAPV